MLLLVFIPLTSAKISVAYPPKVYDVSFNTDTITIKTSDGNVRLKIIDKDEQFISLDKIPIPIITHPKSGTFKIDYETDKESIKYVNKNDYKYEITSDFPLHSEENQPFILSNKDNTFSINVFDEEYSFEFDEKVKQAKIENELPKWSEEKNEKIYTRLGTITKRGATIYIRGGEEDCESLLAFVVANNLGYECDGEDFYGRNDYQTCISLSGTAGEDNEGVNIQIDDDGAGGGHLIMDNCAIQFNETNSDTNLYVMNNGNLTMHNNSLITTYNGYVSFTYTGDLLNISNSTLRTMNQGLQLNGGENIILDNIIFRDNYKFDLRAYAFGGLSDWSLTNSEFYENYWDLPTGAEGINIYTFSWAADSKNILIENITFKGKVYNHWINSYKLTDSKLKNVKSMWGDGPSEYSEDVNGVGLLFDHSHNLTFEDVWIGTVSSGNPLKLITCGTTYSNRNILNNVKARGIEDGLYIGSCDYTELNNYLTWGYSSGFADFGFYFYDSNNLIINNSLFISDEEEGGLLAGCQNATFTDTEFQSVSTDIEVGNLLNSSAIFVNCTFDEGITLKEGSNYTMKWYLDTHIDDGLNFDLENVNINVWDVFNNYQFYGLTDSNGNIERHILTEYFKSRNVTGDYNTTNYYPYKIETSLDPTSQTDYFDFTDNTNLEIDFILIITSITPKPTVLMRFFQNAYIRFKDSFIRWVGYKDL